MGALLNSQLYALERGSPIELGARLEDSKPQGACHLHLLSHGAADSRLGGGFNLGSQVCALDTFTHWPSPQPHLQMRELRQQGVMVVVWQHGQGPLWRTSMPLSFGPSILSPQHII